MKKLHEADISGEKLTFNLFPSNYFFRQYENLVQKASLETNEAFLENHHVFPISIFGKNKKTVAVSYKQHVVLHYLLYRGYQVADDSYKDEAIKMRVALQYFGKLKSAYEGTRLIARDAYASLASKAAARCKGSCRTVEERQKISDRMKAAWADPDFRAKRIAANNTEYAHQRRSEFISARNKLMWAQLTSEERFARNAAAFAARANSSVTKEC